MKKYIVAGIALLVVIAAATASEPTREQTAKAEPAKKAKPQETSEPTEPAIPMNPSVLDDEEKARTKPEPDPESKPSMTVGQENALESAQSYIDGQAFSKKGLTEQLSSQYGEGYSKADARFAVRHVDANWKDEAVEAAESYLDGQSFSRDGLIEQLSSPYGEDFTLAQAQYAVAKVYR